MKVLKSGIEMTPHELEKLRGGAACACGCGIGFSGDQLNASGSGGCYCGCIGEDPEVFADMGHAAAINLNPQV
jgi:hypothetical protein